MFYIAPIYHPENFDESFACSALSLTSHWSSPTRLIIFTVNVIKFQTFFFFCYQVKFWLSGLKFTKCFCSSEAVWSGSVLFVKAFLVGNYYSKINRSFNCVLAVMCSVSVSLPHSAIGWSDCGISWSKSLVFCLPQVFIYSQT